MGLLGEGMQLSLPSSLPHSLSLFLFLLPYPMSQECPFCFIKLSCCVTCPLYCISVLGFILVTRPRTFREFFGSGWVKAPGPKHSSVPLATLRLLIDIQAPLFQTKMCYLSCSSASGQLFFPFLFLLFWEVLPAFAHFLY